MTSNDNVITVEMFNARMDKMEEAVIGINNQLSEIKTEIRDVKYENQLNSAKIEWLQHSIYWGLGIIAFIVAYVSLFKKEKTEVKAEQKNSPTFEEVNNIVDIAISKALAGISR